MDIDFTPIIIILLILAGFTSAIAHSKKRDALSWFFLGLIGGIIALIAVAVMPENKDIQK